MARHPDARRLLSDVAGALNACERAGIPVDLSHEVVVTGYGYVLPIGDPRLGARWQARMKTTPEAAAVITEPAPGAEIRESA
jgi:hypothetical protein